MNSDPLGGLLGDIRLQEFCFYDSGKAMGLILTCIEVYFVCHERDHLNNSQFWFWSSGNVHLVICWYMCLQMYCFPTWAAGMITAKSPCPGELVHVILDVSSEVAHGRPGLHLPLVCLNKLYIPGTGWFTLNIAKFFFIMFKNSFRNCRECRSFS